MIINQTDWHPIDNSDVGVYDLISFAIPQEWGFRVGIKGCVRLRRGSGPPEWVIAS